MWKCTDKPKHYETFAAKRKKKKKISDESNGPNTLTAVHAVNTLALIKECMCCTAGLDRRSRHGF